MTDRFRPAVTVLEDRLTPAVSPADVFAALAQAGRSEAAARAAAAKPAYLINSFTTQFLQAYLPTLTVQSQQAARTLAEYQNQLVAEGAAGPFVGAVSQARFRAEQAAVTAATVTTTIGGTAIQTAPATPPVLTAVPVPRVFDGTTTADGRSTRDLSGVTGLPLAPADPRFQPIGDPVTTPTGPKRLAIADLAVGDGQAYAPGGTLKVFYGGFLADGSGRFDENFDGAPVDFSTTSLIPGFSQGVVGMRPGGVRQIFIPSTLGYAAAGSAPGPDGRGVPPNADLIFEVKLLDPSTPTG